MPLAEHSGGGTGTLDPVEFSYIEWNPAGSPVSIHMSSAAAEAIAQDAADSATQEVGGLLLGRVEDIEHPAVWIERYQPISCAHTAGPEFVLDTAETAALESAAGSILAAGQYAVVGLYRSQIGSGLDLRDTDFNLIRRYFRDPSDLILVVKAGADGKVAGRFHVWDEDTSARPVGEDVILSDSVRLPQAAENRDTVKSSEPGVSAQSGAEKSPFDVRPAESASADAQAAGPLAPGPRNDRPRRLVPDFTPRPIEPAPSVFGLSSPLPPPAADTTTELTFGRVRKWLPLFAAIGVVGGVVWFFAQQNGHMFQLRNSSAAPAASSTTEVARPIGLYVDASGNKVWRVSWNPGATALHNARNVRLFVRERSQQSADESAGTDQNPIDLSASDLAAGSYQYRPFGNDVTFRLEVTDQSGRVSAESFRIVQAKAPSPAPPPKPETPAETVRTVQPKATYRAPAVVAAGVRSRIKGVIPVDVRVDIDTHGHVTSATPITKTHSGIESYLSSRALQAAKEWRFEPARRDGKPVEGSQILHFVFEK